MINLSVLTLYAFSIIVFLSTPGPVTLLVANTGAKHGIKASVKTILGTNFASLILIAISFFVIQELLNISETLLAWLSLFGGLYLIYIAIQMLKEPVHLDLNKNIEAKNYFLHGLILGFSNPKDVLFFIAFFPTFFNIAENPYISISVLTIVWIICDFAVLMLFALLFSKLVSGKIAGFVTKISGGILLLIALYAVYHGISNLI